MIPQRTGVATITALTMMQARGFMAANHPVVPVGVLCIQRWFTSLRLDTRRHKQCLVTPPGAESGVRRNLPGESGGMWPSSELRHINLLVLQAVFLVLQHFALWYEADMLLRTNNRTATAYINRRSVLRVGVQGFVFFSRLCHTICAPPVVLYNSVLYSTTGIINTLWVISQ